MPVQKGTNNFAVHQKEKVAFINERLDQHLGNLRKAKASFEHLSTLAEYLCERLTEDFRAKWIDSGKKHKEPKPFAKSTLYRNHSYRAKVDSFLAGLPPKAGTDNFLSKKNLPMAQAKIHELKAEVSNLKNKITVLEKYIEKLNTCNDEELNKPLSNTKLILDESTINNEFALTAQALSLLLEASEGQFIEQEGQIIATAKLVNNVVVNSKQLSPFMNWLRNQGGINE